jgi:hypothetical protein
LKKENKEIDDKTEKRGNYQKTTRRNRSKRMFKFKSQAKIEYKMFDSEKIVVYTVLILGRYRNY